MKRYIYNLNQAYFYIENGIRPIEQPQVHYKTRHIYFIFSHEETKELYKIWCNKN